MNTADQTLRMKAADLAIATTPDTASVEQFISTAEAWLAFLANGPADNRAAFNLHHQNTPAGELATERSPSDIDKNTA